MSTFLLNVPPLPEPNFGDSIAAQDLRERGIMYEILFNVPFNQNPGAASEHIYNLVDVIVIHV